MNRTGDVRQMDKKIRQLAQVLRWLDGFSAVHSGVGRAGLSLYCSRDTAHIFLHNIPTGVDPAPGFQGSWYRVAMVVIRHQRDGFDVPVRRNPTDGLELPSEI